MKKDSRHYDLVILGAGPAGMTAAIYAARGALSTLVIDESSAGGQVKTTFQVANYPGFEEPVSGYELAANMRKQAERYGAKFELAAETTAIHLTDQEKYIEVDGKRIDGQNILIATGSAPRLLNIPGEQEYMGNGVSYCATCDGDFYKDKDVIVVGGGNSAMEESLSLLKYVKSITVIHQFDELQAEKVTAEMIMTDPKVNFLWSCEPRAIEKSGEKVVMTFEDLKTHEQKSIEKDGIFIFIGMKPNTEFLKGTSLKLSSQGYIETNENMETNIKGVLAAGDVRVKKFRQIATAVSDGAMAALQVIQKGKGIG